ncbi:MAG: hypothetical protein CVU99_02665 [Firmicutes bacterium HGW-Firmicutes-4]|jgi:hypothetical protein|nr:MAG: hypothetical protein CVU98_13250 [Firmicutes bacterium HGW-Firmicutes-3]PKM61681.1 MAG: hypothetical protein CVU99_02665 [Firmicutes bacterium HGW-Firmicutes-4]
MNDDCKKRIVELIQTKRIYASAYRGNLDEVYIVNSKVLLVVRNLVIFPDMTIQKLNETESGDLTKILWEAIESVKRLIDIAKHYDIDFKKLADDPENIIGRLIRSEFNILEQKGEPNES